ncbi:NUDIX domain-containing protein [Chlorobium sp. N1]|uniref:NUDIX domain-containing protein n=1 Tax=Chlorobium sp. N1 TaxID=2491138 RepID=UPI0010408E48|nr:NUDIX domain-containing protein [Chlorobium sp. N1]TCD47659.1 NUDIX domain-containing protein [Chlorobium sp. N1]
MGNVTLRVSALCIRDGSVLLIEHKSFAAGDPAFPESYWILPGGGVERGETLEDAVRREMQEETGLSCRVGPLIFVKELLYPYPGAPGQGSRHHSLSLGFHCEVTGGETITGRDPEYPDDRQMIIRVDWLPISELSRYELYPPFLADYIRKGAASGFEGAAPEFFDSLL